MEIEVHYRDECKTVLVEDKCDRTSLEETQEKCRVLFNLTEDNWYLEYEDEPFRSRGIPNGRIDVQWQDDFEYFLYFRQKAMEPEPNFKFVMWIHEVPVENTA